MIVEAEPAPKQEPAPRPTPIERGAWLGIAFWYLLALVGSWWVSAH